MNGHITHYLCIGCPLGCRLEVEEDAEGEIVEIRGFSCKRGEIYARQEHTSPRRMVSTTVAIDGHIARLPVRTLQSIPKQQVIELCKYLNKFNLTAPVKMGDIIYKGKLGDGSESVTIIATRDVYEMDG